MENSRWLGLITIGLIIAALAVGYFLLTGKLSTNKSVSVQASPTPSVLGQNAQTTPTPAPTPVSAYNRIAARSQNQTQTLPKTGFPIGLMLAFSVSAMIAGFGLRKFPH